ncbi:ATP-binding protein [Marinomonas mediterranea]|jgi:Signal transduction histidine kinase|uniref:histidine kinase n=1 Tax=Marinomonas mediterranea (strain ATCC 700492 / JCM 21426 / NBRC 103028 / MMB-1) TaxID=717774 RepID=F2K2M5_MARM1|nr:ATP-binding protein [Marinomonas mediterranea]ADZ90070.1 integral membrane sensor signal transduction histidine kinase [Marinomonas mediterranea MMB-1]WCN16275.1 HAMP domain-containing protein [Marinomonas mediterranea MMB-1]
MKFWDSFTVFQKLMVILLSSTLVLVSAMLVLARWSYEQGFFDYTNALEQTRLQRLEPKLISLYEEHGSDVYAMPKDKVANIISRFPGRPANAKGPLPPDRARILPGQRAKPPTALFDLNGDFLAGSEQLINPERQFVTVDVKYHGEVIARLSSIPSRHFNSPLETQVSKQQWERSLLFGILSIAAAALLSFFASLVILKPIRRVMSTIGSISKGDYNVRLNETSKDELGELMRDVDYLAYTLHSTQWSRKQWLANISHDMRTPLTVLTGEIQSIKDGIRSFDLERLCSIEQEVNHLRKFTEDIYELSLSDIGGLRYEFKPLDLLEIVSEAVDALRLKAEKSGLTLSLVGKPVIISGDRSRLLQLCKNILTNSVDYTQSPGLVEVSVYWNQDKAVLSISDSAPSVPKGNCRHLFDPLYREDSSRNRVKKGGGLGLAICKNIVDAHKGTIVAKPSQYDGLEIIVELPKS